MTASLNIPRLAFGEPGFDDALDRLLAWEAVSDDAVQSAVSEILAAVRSRGDSALIEYSNRFDRLTATSMQELEI